MLLRTSRWAWLACTNIFGFQSLTWICKRLMILFMDHTFLRRYKTLREKCPNAEFLLVRIFFVFGLNTGKWGPEKTPYLDTFYAVKVNRIFRYLDLVDSNKKLRDYFTKERNCFKRGESFWHDKHGYSKKLTAAKCYLAGSTINILAHLNIPLHNHLMLSCFDSANRNRCEINDTISWFKFAIKTCW